MENNSKKTLANRENGKKGGVKTPEGKNISKLNALKHGIMSKFTTPYDDLDYETVYKMFEEEFGASTPSRKILIEQLAITYIRLRRCARYDSELMREALNPPKYESVIADLSFDRQVSAGEPATIDEKSFNALENVITKYEPSLLSRFIKIIDILSQ